MRTFNRISTALQDSRRFRDLPDIHSERIYLHLLTSKHATGTGLFRMPLGYAVADLKFFDEAAVKRSIEACEDVGLVAYDWENEYVYVFNALAMNPPANPKHATGMMYDLQAVPDMELKVVAAIDFREQIIQKWPGKVNVEPLIETLSIAFPSFADTLSKRYRDGSGNVSIPEKYHIQGCEVPYRHPEPEPEPENNTNSEVRSDADPPQPTMADGVSPSREVPPPEACPDTDTDDLEIPEFLRREHPTKDSGAGTSAASVSLLETPYMRRVNR